MSDEIFELTDVEVDTLGLVKRGANRESFFLLKADSADTADVSPAIAASLWQRITQVIAKAFHNEATIAAAATTDKTASTEAPEVAEVEVEADAVESEEVEDETPAQTPAQTPVAAAELETPVAETPVAETVETAKTETTIESAPSPTDVCVEIAHNAQKEFAMSDVDVEKAAAMRLTELEKANQDLLLRVEKAEQEAAHEREQRERATFLAKAQSYAGLPCSPGELADHLYWLAKTDAAREAWLAEVLQTVSNLLSDAALFAELGTSAVPDDAGELSKAAKAEDPAAALLAVSKEAQLRYLYERRAAIKGA